MNRELHIVCLDAPYPPDYGGAIDMFQKIVSLHQKGIKIHLHYFNYRDRGNVDELQKYCVSINDYQRKTGKQGLGFGKPYIVTSRTNDELSSNLNKDNHPIIIEGIHCTGVLTSIDSSKRKVIVRLHNDENAYYKRLARSEHGFLKKLFFWRESRLLKKYQSHLPKNCRYVSISESDVEVFREKYLLPEVEFLPAFISWPEIKSEEGMGSFCLYHGNLSVSENEKAANWLLTNVFTKIKVPLVIAGKNPSRKLSKMAHLCQHTCLVADPSEKEINDLVRKAHINILPSFNSTGVKLKLLHALFEGRHCVVNDAAVKGSALEDACHIGNNATGFASIITQLYHHPFAQEEIVLRKKLLCELYNNSKNAEKLIAWLY